MIDSFTGLSFQTLLNAVSDAILLIDDSDHIVLTNVAAQQLFGYVDHELCGLAIEELISPHYQDLYQYYRKVYLGKPWERDIGNDRTLVVLTHDKQELKVNIGLNPLTAHDQLYILITLNISDRRRQAEVALKVSEERLWLAKQAAALGVLDIDFENNVIHIDKRMRELWGCGTEEIMTYDKFIRAIHPKDYATHQAAFEKAMDPAGDGHYLAEFRVINAADGFERWITITGQVHFEIRRANRLIGMARDITKRKTLEKELQMQRAESEVLFKQQVAIHTASAIAHELNQPLTAISAYSEVTLRAMESKAFNIDEVRQMLENCVKQSQHAGRRLHELVAFLQKGEMVTEKLSLNEVVTDALKIAHSEGYNDFHHVLHLESNLPAVLANRLHIQKTLVNLLINAVESMRAANVSSPAITIAISILNEKNLAMVSVLNTGPGIDQEIVRYIFDPFFTTKPTGIGMGLSISRALIEANGGQLWLDPDTKEGAKFNFTLPFAS